MRATFELPVELGAHVIDAALEGLVRAAEAEVASGTVPPLATSGVRYRREGGESWLTPSRVLQRGHGDCEDLAAWRAAELRVHGIDPSARAVVYRSGPRTWHAVVERDGGRWHEDPSIALGMPAPRNTRWPTVEIGRHDCPSCGRGWFATWYIDRERITGFGPEPEDAIRAETSVIGDEVGFGIDISSILRPVAEAVTSVVDAATGRARQKPQSAQSSQSAQPAQPSQSARDESPISSDDPDVLRFASKIARWLRRERARAIREVTR